MYKRQFDDAAGEWLITGRAVVSEDGSVLVTDEGGVTTLGWKGLGTNPTVSGGDPALNPWVLPPDSPGSLGPVPGGLIRSLDAVADLAAFHTGLGIARNLPVVGAVVSVADAIFDVGNSCFSLGTASSFSTFNCTRAVVCLLYTSPSPRD